MGDREAEAGNLGFMRKVIRVGRLIAHTSYSTYRMSRAACVYGADQKWFELVGLAHLVREINPQITMEIGLYRGGTISLWAQLMQVKSTLIGVDVQLSDGIEKRIRAKMKHGQHLHLLEADSHSSETKRRVLKLIGDNKIDFLFIDGDHSYEGVKKDFDDYSSIIRPGGHIAFHDIIPDFSARYGTKTDADSGGVYRFWRQINSQFPHYEFIESVSQDGCGIGVLRV
jgi:predicted O-methyltransferase YrrM